jgi:hypothetical protein
MHVAELGHNVRNSSVSCKASGALLRSMTR